ncbi:transposase, IS4 family [Corynebacterium efficiens YS-314]|uniref:Putative transposase n=1 Tax=Corynebacterium efficiens (strain DSM 44549 / YS-314 / AJ 12310 / JCM 11189 / NBRC 100395) TaxID=196164 RepID=Q8FLG6_COREF|nr:transposase, IS4 family [Corynebacterium efficiens YS-314]BAC19791.1 putative transposase [Corynebacterium efficiens YS-314]
MPALPSSIIDPLWCQFAALIPPVTDTHPLRCHRPRIPDRIIFDKLIQVLVLGASYVKIADTTCSATTLRTRRDEWITAGIFEQLEQICLEFCDRIVGLDLENLSVDGCIVKAPCGGEAAGRSPVDRGKQGTKRSLLVDGAGIPLGCVVAGANRHDSPLLRPTLEKLGRFGLALPDQITVHLDAGYDSSKTRSLLTELGCEWVISQKGVPLQAGARWVVERTNSWHNRGFKKLQVCTERRIRVIEAFISLANAVIVVRRLVRGPGAPIAGRLARPNNPDLSARSLIY